MNIWTSHLAIFTKCFGFVVFCFGFLFSTGTGNKNRLSPFLFNFKTLPEIMDMVFFQVTYTHSVICITTLEWMEH